MLMILALAVGCITATDVPEFKDRMHEACERPGSEAIKVIELRGDHARLRVTMTRVATEPGRVIAGTQFAADMRHMAREVYRSIRWEYKTERFEYVYKDGNGISLCGFAFVPDEANKLDLPVSAECLTEVGPIEPGSTPRWWQ